MVRTSKQQKVTVIAQSHYVMDLYYPLAVGSERTRREVMRIDAADDKAAIAEGQRIDGWRKTQFYEIRAIHSSSRAGDKLVFSSRPDELDATADDASAKTLVTPAPVAG